jgi:hypothetical protein
MTWFLISLIISLVMGLSFVRVLLGTPSGARGHLLHWTLGWISGMGISSALAFAWLWLFGPLSIGYRLVEVGICLPLLLWLIPKTGMPWGGSKTVDRSRLGTKPPPWVAVVFFSLIALNLLLFISIIYIEPHGRFDAWYIWNARARFLFRGGAYWADGFSSWIAHADYPLLIPLNIARGWYYLGQEKILVPAVIHGLFVICSVGLLFSSVSALCSPFQGILAGITLVGTPFFIWMGADQIADVPVGLYYLATIILFNLHDQKPKERRGYLVLAGVMAGISGWTKNEGLLFILSVLLVRMTAPLPGGKAYGRTMFSFLLGLFPVLLIVMVFKIHLAPPNDLFGARGLEDLFQKLLDIPRHTFILRSFGLEAWNFGHWPSISILPLLFLYAVILGISEPGVRKTIRPYLISLGIMILGFYFIFLVSPHDLAWHLSTAAGRLILQLWPTFLFLYFLLVTPPEPWSERRTSP